MLASFLNVTTAKAFDCVGHSFMEKVYNFLGFGKRIKGG